MATNSNYFIAKIYPKLLVAGNGVCHQLDERSYHFGVRKYPLCARCTGMYFGFITGLVAYFAFVPPLYVCFVLALPMPIDGFTQLLTKYESTNSKRLLTGLPFGYGVASLFMVTVSLVTS